MNLAILPGRAGARGLSLHFGLRECATSLAITVVASVVAFAGEPQLGEVGAALVFVLGITLAGALGGLATAIITALVTFLLYNFYLAEPVLTFRIASGRDITPLIVFNLCAVVAGVLAGRLKDRAQAADRSNLNLASLLEVSEVLQSALRLEDVAAGIGHAAIARMGGGLRILFVDKGRLRPFDDATADDATLSAAERALHAASPMIEDGFAYLCLVGSAGPVGVLIVENDHAQRFGTAFMTALVNLTALALERAMLSEQVAETRAMARTEELQSALLSSISHDFRTPLTTISASASSLIEFRGQLDDRTSVRMLRGIVDECDRLNRYTANLLELSRLEAGQPHIRRQILSVSDVMGVVVARWRDKDMRRHIHQSSEPDLLVSADAALLELVLINVIDNAILYSGGDGRIEISCARDGGYCRIEVADEGIGIPAADLARIFDRFVRLNPGRSPHGSGLGLAIARGFVEALGGRIAALVPGIGDRGTRIVIHLPLAKDAA